MAGKENPLPEDKPLTKKEAFFVDYLFICGLNGYAAAVKSGYSEKSGYEIASRLLRKVNISKAVQSRMNEVHLSSDEALAILATHARGDLGDFMDDNGNLDIELARKTGMTKLIKKIKQRTTTKIGKGATDDDTETHDLEIELHDPQSAIDKILRVHGKFVEKLDLSNSDGSLSLPPEQIAQRVASLLEIAKKRKDNAG